VLEVRDQRRRGLIHLGRVFPNSPLEVEITGRIFASKKAVPVSMPRAFSKGRAKSSPKRRSTHA
jgi:hypothetical protein